MRAKRNAYRISTLVIVQMGFEIVSTWLKQFDKHISKFVINPFVVLWTSDPYRLSFTAHEQIKFNSL